MYVDTKRLRAERVARGLTQAEIAKRLGWTSAKYARRENGIVKITADELVEIMRALGCDVLSDITIFFYPKSLQNVN